MLAPAYGKPGFNRVGLAITIALHLLLLLIYIFKPQKETTAPQPSGADITYIAPLKDGKPKKTPPKSEPKQTKQVKATPPPKIERLPNTITLPHEKPVPIVETEPPKKIEPPAEVDMAAYIEARRRARGANQNEQPAEESEDARATRIAKANIAAANGRSHGDDKNETGGVFSISNQTFASAEVKFRGWNPNFKRRWLQQVAVEQGGELDIETAVIKKMIELIRKEKTGDFDWDSQRLQRVVHMSARVQDTEELQAFLFKEMFPNYRAPPGRR